MKKKKKKKKKASLFHLEKQKQVGEQVNGKQVYCYLNHGKGQFNRKSNYNLKNRVIQITGYVDLITGYLITNNLKYNP